MNSALAPRLDAGTEPAAPAPLIRVIGVSKQYRRGARVVKALEEIDLDIRKGEIFGIIGRSGAGKSSLLRTLNRLEPVGAGRVEVDGLNVATLRGPSLIALRRRMGMIFQHFNLLSSATVLENLILPMKAAGHSRAAARERAEQLLALVGLDDKAGVYPSRLSGGQKQRVGIARALMLEPDILLCDEATSALDPETTASILDLLRDINARLGLTIVLITHEMGVIRDLCHRVAVLEQGRVVEEGPVWRVFGHPEAEATKALLAPLRGALEPELRRRMRVRPESELARAVVRLRYSEQEGDRHAVVDWLSTLGGEMDILQCHLEPIQEHLQGEVTVRVPVHRLDALAARHPDLEVLGYV